MDGVGRSFPVPSFRDHFIMEKTSPSPIVPHIYATKTGLLRNENKSDWLWGRAEKRNQAVGHRERLEMVRRLVTSRFGVILSPAQEANTLPNPCIGTQKGPNGRRCLGSSFFLIFLSNKTWFFNLIALEGPTVPSPFLINNGCRSHHQIFVNFS